MKTHSNKQNITHRSQYFEWFCLLLFIFIYSFQAKGQDRQFLKDIHLLDTLTYTSIKTEGIYKTDYPPSNLFDGNFRTCWVAGSAKAPTPPSIFLKLPELPNPVLNIFPGYGKSQQLFEANAFPQKIRISLIPAVTQEGFRSNWGLLYIGATYTEEQIIQLHDKPELQSIPLDFSPKKLTKFKQQVHQAYHKKYNTPLEDSCLMVKLEFLDPRVGKQSNDLCISEIFFNDRYVPDRPTEAPQVLKVYENQEQNAVLLDNSEKNGIVVFQDTSKVVQLTEVAPNKNWAVIITMPANSSGRTETTYHLIDLINQEVVNEKLIDITGQKNIFGPMFFESGPGSKLILRYSLNQRIELHTPD